MAIPTWHAAIDQLTPHIFRIVTPDGSGTGWLLSVSTIVPVCAIATAAHVIEHAHYWEEPIRLHHVSSGETVLLRPPDRAINIHEKTDTAALIFNAGSLKLPKSALPLMQKDYHLKSGIEIGWLGFPGVAVSKCCFFSGYTSAYLDEEESYFVDGVAINGVSGGPAFRRAVDTAELIGIVSAYIPNRATGDVLPGVAVVRAVNRLHEVTTHFKTLDEARAQQTPPREEPPAAPKVNDGPGGGS